MGSNKRSKRDGVASLGFHDQALMRDISRFNELLVECRLLNLHAAKLTNRIGKKTQELNDLQARLEARLDRNRLEEFMKKLGLGDVPGSALRGSPGKESNR